MLERNLGKTGPTSRILYAGPLIYRLLLILYSPKEGLFLEKSWWARPFRSFGEEDLWAGVWGIIKTQYLTAGHSGLRLYAQHFGSLQWEDCLRPRIQDQPRQHSSISDNCVETSWAWWHVPVVPANGEAEVRGLLEFGNLRLQWAMIMLVHSSLGNKAKPYL